MTQLFGVPIDTLANALLVTTLIIIGVIVLLAPGNAIFFKIGARNIPRRRVQMLLITFALMLSTTLLSSVLATGDVITGAVQSVAVYNLGNVDETIQGGHGDLGYFPQSVYDDVQNLAHQDSDIAAVGAALVEHDLLVADVTSRQVRSKVTALGIVPGSERGFGGMHDDAGNSKKIFAIEALGANDVYLNHTIAQLLNARAGDFIYLYSQRWPGMRYELHVVGVVQNGGLTGEAPAILSRINVFRDIENRYNDITQIFISNRGGGGVGGVNLSARVAERLERTIPDDVSVSQVKQQGVQTSQKAQEIFSRVFALFSFFALAIALLLIFLIFVLLAAERRVEMGMARAIGVQRRHLILMFLFEGSLYDFIASAVGLAIGLGAGAALVYFLGPILTRFNFPLKLTFQLHSLIIAYCLGVIFTFCAIAISSWLVSRMTVVEAMRDQPEPGHGPVSLGELCLRVLHLGALLGAQLPWLSGKGGASPARPSLKMRARKIRRILLEQFPDTLVELVRSITLLGFLPLLIGYWLMQLGLEQAKITYFSGGLTLIALGAGLLLRALVLFVFRLVAQFNTRLYMPVIQRGVTRVFVTITGLALVAYWALPFDALAGLGLPRFQGGIDIFFLAGVMMVLGGIWVGMANAGVFIRPVLALFSRLPGLYVLSRLASAYPLQRRFRTGLSVVMFSMVIFAMTVMAVITNAMSNTYTDINTQTGGYDIQAVAYFKPLPNLGADLAKFGISPAQFSQIGVRTTTAVGMVQLSTAAPRWSLYPAQVVSGGFLNGYGLQLVARAQGFTSDDAIWQALKAHANYALIDSSALPYRPGNVIDAPVYDPSASLPADAGTTVYPPGFPSEDTFSLGGVYQGDASFPATPVWVADVQRPTALKLTIIGVVDNSDSAHFGLYISQAAYKDVHATQALQLASQINSSDGLQTTYYFKVAPGQDKRALSLKLGSAFLDYGLETTVLEDAIWDVRGPRIFLSNLLLGVVAVTLLLGVAALAITGTRAVIERRQQIGMLRALGCGRHMIQGAFLCESFLVGAAGSIAGVVLGLILARNIFAANFFEQYQTGLFFSIPWQELSLIVAGALLASFIGALLPAWQAGRIAPAEALRYE